MVENKNQWEETEYNEEQEYSQDYSDENEDSDQSDNQDYNESYDEYGEDEEDEENEPKKKSNPLPMLIIFIILIGIIAFILFSKMSGANKHADTENVNNNNMVASSFENNNNQDNPAPGNDPSNAFFEQDNGLNNQNNDMMSVNFNDAGATNVVTGEEGNQQVATVTESNPNEVAQQSDLFDNQTNPNAVPEAPSQENNAIMVVYNKAARSNPFKPPVLDKSTDDVPFEVLNDTQFEIIEPPTTSISDENLTRLLKTKISGILYDDNSPSAIVNLNGMDYFVKQGDTVSGYTIQYISRDQVQINYKDNSYVASVGELFSRGNLDKNQAVANLEHKFAGRYKK